MSSKTLDTTTWRLKFERLVEECIVIGQEVTVELAVVSNLDVVVSCPRNQLRVNAKAVWSAPRQEACSVVDISPTSFIVGEDGKASTKFRINRLLSKQDNSGICLSFELVQNTSSIMAQRLEPTPLVTPAIYCVGQRLVIESVVNGKSIYKDDKPITMREPFAWYKDTGGAEQCIELQTKLVDGNGRLVKNQHGDIPLNIKLVYENGRVVEQQGILEDKTDNLNKNIDASSGTGVVKFRINEVSSNHRHQRFVVVVEPTAGPYSDTIAPAYSVPMDIKTKKNKKRTKDESSGSLASAAASSGYSNKKSKGKSEKSDASSSRSSSPVETNAAAAAAASSHRRLGDSRLKLAGHALSSRSTDQGSSQRGVSRGITGPNHIAPYEAPQYEQAVNIVVEWAENLVASLDSLKWRPVGFQNGGGMYDGTPGTIVNPNPTLSSIEQQYHEYAEPSLRYLRFLLEYSRDVGGGSGSSSSSNGLGGGNVMDRVNAMNGDGNHGTSLHRGSVGALGLAAPAAMRCDSMGAGEAFDDDDAMARAVPHIALPGVGSQGWLPSLGNLLTDRRNAAAAAGVVQPTAPMVRETSGGLSAASAFFEDPEGPDQSSAKTIQGLVEAPTLLRNQSLFGGGVGDEDDEDEDDDQAVATSTQTTAALLRSGSDGLLLPLPLAPQRQGMGSGLGPMSLSMSGGGGGLAHFSSSSSSSSSSSLRGDHGSQGGEHASLPVMERQESSMSQFYRSVGAELAGGRDELLRFPSMNGPSGPFLGNTFMGGGINGSLERDVQYILAVADYITNVGVLGMPAFNQSKKLIGFYRSEQGADKITRTVFKNVPVTVTQTDREEASQRLENAIVAMNSSSFSSSSSRSNDVSIQRQGPLFVLSEWQNNLDEMKDDAMICYMIKEDEVNASREEEQQRTMDGVDVDDEEDGDDDDGDGDEMVQ